jgi:hypothetical protein
MKKIRLLAVVAAVLGLAAAASTNAKDVTGPEAKWCQSKCGEYECPADKYKGFERVACVAKCEKPCAEKLKACLAECSTKCDAGKTCNMDACRNECHTWKK